MREGRDVWRVAGGMERGRFRHVHGWEHKGGKQTGDDRDGDGKVGRERWRKGQWKRKMEKAREDMEGTKKELRGRERIEEGRNGWRNGERERERKGTGIGRS